MDATKITTIGLTIMIHKHMAQSESAVARGDKEAHKKHEAAAKVLSAELNKRKAGQTKF